MVEPPKLRVVQNPEPVTHPDWLKFPETVNARSPFDRNERCLFRIARPDLQKLAEADRRQPVYDLWSNVIGKPPPVSGSVEPPNGQLKTLWNAHACWRGIERPCGDDDNGENHVAYCINATVTYKFEAKPPATYARLITIPNTVVFVVFAKLDEPSNHLIKGVLTHWQFIQMDVNNASVPLGHDVRFAKRLW